MLDSAFNFALIIEKDIDLGVTLKPGGRCYANNFFFYCVFFVFKLGIGHFSYLVLWVFYVSFTTRCRSDLGKVKR